MNKLTLKTLEGSRKGHAKHFSSKESLYNDLGLTEYEDARPLIAITRGDPAGIGPEVIEKALRDEQLSPEFRYEVIGETPDVIQLGRSNPDSARAALAALHQAFLGWKAGRYAAIVTGPIQKETITAIEPDFIGQTEFFARQCRLRDDDAVMVLTDPKLTVALVTTHCSIRAALDQITVPRLCKTTQELHRFLQKRGLAQPRLALAGINPHAGENGLFGREEIEVLVPAVRQLQAQGINLTGPLPPDTVFHHAAQGAYDAVVCAYHDQGLIPFKLLAFHTGVNITLGLPLIRTSPDHGTALNLAGQGKADPRSMLAAIRLAGEMVLHPTGQIRDS